VTSTPVGGCCGDVFVVGLDVSAVLAVRCWTAPGTCVKGDVICLVVCGADVTATGCAVEEMDWGSTTAGGNVPGLSCDCRDHGGCCGVIDVCVEASSDDVTAAVVGTVIDDVTGSAVRTFAGTAADVEETACCLPLITDCEISAAGTG